MPALICIGAEVRLRLGSQTRQIALQDLYLDYMKNAMQRGEFIEAVIVPRRDVALRLDGNRVSDIKIAFGGMAAIPKRAVATENLLRGEIWNEETVQQGMQRLKQDFRPLSDMRASAGYRSQVAANLLYRFYLHTSSSTALNVFEVTA